MMHTPSVERQISLHTSWHAAKLPPGLALEFILLVMRQQNNGLTVINEQIEDKRASV
jgi:hypothetical protein